MTEETKDNTVFNVGDRVSYSVGSDRYAGTVQRVTKARVWVRPEGGGDVVMFTKRPNGQFRRVGFDTSGLLGHGGETYYDPHF